MLIQTREDKGAGVEMFDCFLMYGLLTRNKPFGLGSLFCG